jgi:hypothetical protein
MEEPVSLFSPAEYLTTFTTFIYGYVATQFLSGWSSMITHRKAITFSKEHIGWTIFTFILFMDIWWTSWRKTEIIASGNLIFYSSLATPFVFYFLSHLLFPDLDALPGNNLRTYLTPVTRKVMVTFIFLLLSFFVSDIIFPNYLPLNEIIIAVGVALAAVLIIFPEAIYLRRIFQWAAGGLLFIHLFALLKFPQPYTQINGFSFEEYLTVFLTFIYGFVTWRFLEGWGLVITNYRKLTLGYDFIPWTIMAFLLMLDMWWGTWAREDYLPKNIIYFFVSLIVPILFYFMSAVIFPLELLKRGYVRLHQYYYRNRKAICLFFGLILLTNAFVSYAIEEKTFFSSENLFRFLGITLAMAGIISSRIIYHRIILFLGTAIIIIHAITE